jgi:hypothetical protein
MAAGPWRGWAICPALVIRDVESTRRVHRQDRLSTVFVDEVASSLAESHTAVVLDLEPDLGAAMAARLHQLRLAHAVLVLPRWPYTHAILPTDELITTLIRESRRLETSQLDLPNVAFVLDCERSKSVPQRPKHDPCADNRYTLSAADLPDLKSLRERGIRRVLKIAYGPA